MVQNSNMLPAEIVASSKQLADAFNAATASDERHRRKAVADRWEDWASMRAISG